MYMALDEGEITNVEVSEACRNRGYGEQLVTELMQQGRNHGISRYVLEVRVSNEPAIRLYQKLGFSVLGTRKNFYEKPSALYTISVTSSIKGGITNCFVHSSKQDSHTRSLLFTPSLAEK